VTKGVIFLIKSHRHPTHCIEKSSTCFLSEIGEMSNALRFFLQLPVKLVRHSDATVPAMHSVGWKHVLARACERFTDNSCAFLYPRCLIETQFRLHMGHNDSGFGSKSSLSPSCCTRWPCTSGSGRPTPPWAAMVAQWVPVIQQGLQQPIPRERGKLQMA
jgi:hypothetical protein